MAERGKEVKFNREKAFLCIDYPAVVKNVDKMLETLGGEAHISVVHSDPVLRLDLKFRPKDIHCKSAYADKVNTTRLLLKVRRRRPKLSAEASSTAEAASQEPCISDILGIVDQTYKFKTMADFQFLPMQSRGEGGGFVSTMDKLVPSKMHSSSWMAEDSPMLLAPLIFSRIDNPCEYHFRKDPNLRKNMPEAAPQDDGLISRIRQKRAGYTIFANYDEKTVPQKPHENASKMLQMKACTKELVAKVKRAFEERPIWSRSALLSRISIAYKHQLRYVLPAVAYYFITGPWRGLWVCFGYDPRVDPKAKIYQLLDFRVRKHVGKEKVPVSGTRPGFYNVLPIKFVNPSHTKTATIDKENLAGAKRTHAGDEDAFESERPKMDAAYMFAEGVMPPCRQMFYQLCDVHVDEVQKMIHENDGQETACTEKDGWCNANVTEKCRNMMMALVEQSAAADGGADPKDLNSSQDDQGFDSDSESDPDHEFDEFSDEIAKNFEDMEMDDV